MSVRDLVDWLTLVFLLTTSVGSIVISNILKKSKIDLMENAEKVKEDLNAKHAELVDGQNRVIRDFDAKHYENKSGLKAHMDLDDQKFGELSRTLGRIESKIDKSNGK